MSPSLCRQRIAEAGSLEDGSERSKFEIHSLWRCVFIYAFLLVTGSVVGFNIANQLAAEL
jgi:hypothetical protein